MAEHECKECGKPSYCSCDFWQLAAQPVQWEYAMALVDIDVLNGDGAQGWEAVGVLPNGLILMKRLVK